jgi:hypothetical protein
LGIGGADFARRLFFFYLNENWVVHSGAQSIIFFLLFIDKKLIFSSSLYKYTYSIYFKKRKKKLDFLAFEPSELF